MASKLGCYWSVMHRRPQDYEFFKRLNPSVMKVMDGGPPDYQWIRENLPDALVVARIHALSEQHDDMRKDPVGTGIRHANEWNEHATKLGLDRSRTLVLGQNEPRVWEPGVPEALRLYTIALCDRATELGLRVGAMQLSVGWPANDGPDTPPNWSLWHGVDNAIRRNNGALVLHEYWADNGPGENWGWWAGRSLKCPWQVPIVIGECGIDMYVKDGSVAHANRGWRGHVDADRYARELADYVGRMSADKRFVGCAVFAADFANGEWASFDIEPAYQAILATPIPDVQLTTTPATVHLPSVSGGTQPATLYVSAPAGANLRKAPVRGDIIKAVPFGEPVTLLEPDPVDSFLLVQHGDVSGWMYQSLLSLEQPAEPTPAPQPTQPSGDKWQRTYAFTARWEGEYQNVHNDAGNWTGGAVGVGELRGTKYGISAASYPHLDIQNLTRAQAERIYQADYWQASGANALPWPACLLVFDTAVLHGVGTAKAWLSEVGPNPYLFAAKRLRVYTKMSNFDFWGKAWVNRVADLLEEMAR